MIWKQFEVQGLLNGKCSHEINLVFDNCTGQNKNRMVTRLLFYLVKLKICSTARAIFLVKGHTKNDCDRMFNLLKAKYRKSNVYTPLELMELMNTHPQCNAIYMKPSDFKNWDALENTMVKKATSILSNHIFVVRARDSNRMMMQEFSGEPYKRQVLVLEQFQDVDWKEHFQLAVAVPPGLPDIKWNELYAKWGRFVPEDRKAGLSYYVNKPPKSVIKRIEAQAKAARLQRAQRARAGAEVSTAQEKKETKKKNNGAAKKKPPATKKKPPATKKKPPAKAKVTKKKPPPKAKKPTAKKPASK
jgi:hypothetical protein